MLSTKFVPNLRNNLDSISSITEKCYTVTLRKNKAAANRSSGSIMATAVRNGQLYCDCENKNQTLQSVQNKYNNLMKWHQ